MNNEIKPELRESSNSTLSSDSVGAYLHKIRTSNGIDFNEISDKTKFSTSQLKAVEQEQWSALPDGFVLRSLVKKFALAIGADDKIALQKLGQATGNIAPSTVKNLRTVPTSELNESMPDTDTPRRTGGSLLWILLILIVLGVVAYLAYNQGMFTLEDLGL